MAKSSLWRVNVLSAFTYLSKNHLDNLISRIFPPSFISDSEGKHHIFPIKNGNSAMFQEIILCKQSGRDAGPSRSCINSSHQLINCNSTSLSASFKCCQIQRPGKRNVRGHAGKYCSYQLTVICPKGLEKLCSGLGTFWEHKTENSHLTSILHDPCFPG